MDRSYRIGVGTVVQYNEADLMRTGQRGEETKAEVKGSQEHGGRRERCMHGCGGVCV